MYQLEEKTIHYLREMKKNSVYFRTSRKVLI